MEIIPRQLSERAVRQKLRQHVARRRVESDRVKILHAIKEPGAANESVEDHATGVMPRAVVAHVNAADAQCRSQRSGVDLDASGVQAADDVLIPGNNRIGRVAGPNVVDTFKPNHVGQSG